MGHHEPSTQAPRGIAGTPSKRAWPASLDASTSPGSWAARDSAIPAEGALLILLPTTWRCLVDSSSSLPLLGRDRDRPLHFRQG